MPPIAAETRVRRAPPRLLLRPRNIFCRIFGHTWWPEIDVPDHRWNTTKDGNILVSTVEEKDVRHYELCKRCGETRDVAPRRHDRDGLDAPAAAEPAEKVEAAETD